MPIDNREERQSAISFLLRSFVPGVAPSIIDQAERQSAAYSYPGILAGPPPILGPGIGRVFGFMRVNALGNFQRANALIDMSRQQSGYIFAG